MTNTKPSYLERPSIAEWLPSLADWLYRDTGEKPRVGRHLSGQKPVSAPDLLWWRSSSKAPGDAVWVGVSRSGWQTVADRSSVIGQRIELEKAYASALDESWGRDGELRGEAPPTPAEVVRVEFADAPPVDLFVAFEGPAPVDEEDDALIPQRQSLDVLRDIELPVTLRFGRARMTLEDVLRLDSGSVVGFDRRLDEPVELLVNGCVVAFGEAVTVHGNYAVRISEIVSRRERLSSGPRLEREQGRIG
jgi:flagellar motor switch protein FliN